MVVVPALPVDTGGLRREYGEGRWLAGDPGMTWLTPPLCAPSGYGDTDTLEPAVPVDPLVKFMLGLLPIACPS